MLDSKSLDKNKFKKTQLTADIVSAYVSNNTTQVDELPDLIININAALSGSGSTIKDNTAAPKPAVRVSSSIKKNFIVCLECGGKFKSLKRHLGATHKMQPEKYRVKWSLPKNYPMVAPKYAAYRSELAKEFGLGVNKKK